MKYKQKIIFEKECLKNPNEKKLILYIILFIWTIMKFDV